MSVSDQIAERLALREHLLKGESTLYAFRSLRNI
jgi:hypothetical protein